MCELVGDGKLGLFVKYVDLVNIHSEFNSVAGAGCGSRVNTSGEVCSSYTFSLFTAVSSVSSAL